MIAVASAVKSLSFFFFCCSLSGHFLPYKAVAAGKSEPEAMNYLEKRVADLNTLSDTATIELAIQTMQYVLSTDFKNTEIEIGEAISYTI